MKVVVLGWFHGSKNRMAMSLGLCNGIRSYYDRELVGKADSSTLKTYCGRPYWKEGEHGVKEEIAFDGSSSERELSMLI